MQFQYTPYILPLLLSAIISGWMAVYVWQRRQATRGAEVLALLAVAITEWSIGYALEIAGADLPTKIFWGKSQYVGIVTVPLLWAVFAYLHSNQGNWLTRRKVALLVSVPFITLVLAFTTELHGLIWQDMHIDRAVQFSALAITHGAWFWVHSVYSYILLLVGTILIIRSIGRLQGQYRSQVVALLIAVLLPWAANAAFLLGFNPIPNLDLTPFAFTISVVALTWGIIGFQLIDISPVARGLVVDDMRDGVIVLDRQGHVADINPAAQKVIGLSAAQAIGQRAIDALKPWSTLLKRYENMLEAQDEVYLGTGESQVWYELRLSPLYDSRKRLLGRVITARDITERKRVETLLRESETRYRQFIENANDIIYRTDAAGRFIFCNPVALQKLGYGTEAEVVGKHYLELASPQWHQRMKRFYARQLLAGEPNTYFEFPAIAMDGHEIWLGQNVQLVHEGEKIIGFQAVARDITERKQIEQKLAIARDQALEASRAKSRLLAKVSHELRTPLGSVLGYAELLHSNAFGKLEEKQTEATTHIIDSANYLTAMVNELLDEAQIESGSVKLNIHRFAPREMLAGLEPGLGVLARNKGLTLTTAVAPNLPESLYGDENRLRQILFNLTGNAVKFTEAGWVRLIFSQVDSAHWALQVSDSGIGIPTEAQTYIFEPFRQVDNSITRNNRGTGLGLAITKSLVELMGGQIILESDIGQGSAFTVVLPIVQVEENIT